MDRTKSFERFFKKATGKSPYDYQTRLATCETLPGLINVPTGLGKTLAVVVAWLWRRSDKSGFRKATPRRLVFCLPMRTLVEQTVNVIRACLASSGLADSVDVHVLMGGESAADWDLHPEREAILIGTQDMLLSRALNRGYAMSRYRWPMQFGLLNSDCLWVYDEIQLMGTGLATTAQLAAFRSRFWPPAVPCGSIWMSATMQPSWLKTVDFSPEVLGCLGLEKADRENPEVRRRHRAKKPLSKAKATIGDAAAVAAEIRAAHRSGSRTLAVVNTVERARAIHRQLRKLAKRESSPPQMVLIHSRFRLDDRHARVKELLAAPSDEGTIIVSTQVVEAGVDVSATVLFTELAPWPAIVQRFGRCNRAGDDRAAHVFWLDLPRDKTAQEKTSPPYALDELLAARKLLGKCESVGPADLPDTTLDYEHRHVIRSKDLLDLFDTTPDLAGDDIDIDRYVREVEESDVQVFWRDWPAGVPEADLPSYRPGELCRVGCGEFREFLRKRNEGSVAFRWAPLDQQWLAARADKVFPGQVYLLHVSAGGYSPDGGWDPAITELVTPFSVPPEQHDSNDADLLSETDAWQTVAEHTTRVLKATECLCEELGIACAAAVRLAAIWHDRGKVHEVFQNRILDQRHDEPRPEPWRGCRSLAKAPRGHGAETGWWKSSYERTHFRHELASALAVLLAPTSLIPAELRNLVAYLVAAHHGKVRLLIRSLPDEDRPTDAGEGKERRFARGIWDADELPAIDLGVQSVPAVRLSLEVMELGLCQQPPFAGEPSWAERMLDLRDRLGPFHLAFLEAILRAADMRASGGELTTRNVDEESDHA